MPEISGTPATLRRLLNWRYQRARLFTRHPLTGERLWRIRLKMWFWETFRV